MTVFALRAFESIVRLELSDPTLEPLVRANFGAMSLPDPGVTGSALRYRLDRDGARFVVRRDKARPRRARNTSDLLFLLEKDITIELQKLRRDLYFVHGAALERSGGAILLVAASGVGKSTTAWALLHHGFRYLSDELAPIDASMRVHPYPHALCLKSDPPGGYALPDTTLRTTRTLHVPAGALPADTVFSPCPLEAIFFLQRPSMAVDSPPQVRALSPAEAAARLYTQALNALAHPADGLDAAVRIAGAAPCFALITGDLAPTCQCVESALAAESATSAVAPASPPRRTSRNQRASRRSGRRT